jgi:hypothetical protein
MTPWQLAKQWHDEHIATETFTEALGWHLSAGVVYSAPDAFMLAREVHWDAGREEVVNDSQSPNAWFVELAAVSDGADAFGRFMRVAPHPQPWVLWCRRGEMRVRAFNWNKLSKKTGGQ